MTINYDYRGSHYIPYRGGHCIPHDTDMVTDGLVYDGHYIQHDIVMVTYDHKLFFTGFANPIVVIPKILIYTRYSTK